MGDSGTSIVLIRYETMDYDLFAKVKEPLRGTKYNTRDELIRAIGRPIWNINKDGCVDGEWRLPNIWQKMINKGGYGRYINVVPLWIKPCQKYQTVALAGSPIICPHFRLFQGHAILSLRLITLYKIGMNWKHWITNIHDPLNKLIMKMIALNSFEKR